MRILLIHQMFLEEDDPGGSRFNEMTRIWTNMGHQVTVLAGMMHYVSAAKRPEYKGKLFFSRKQGEVEVLRCHVSESYNKNFAGRLWGYFSFMFSATWAGLFKTKGKYDLILATSPPLFVGVTSYVLSRIKRVPYIFEIRDLWPESAIDTGVLTNKFIIKISYWVESFLYKKAALINVLTPAFKEHLINHKGVLPAKIVFIPNAADFSISDEILLSFDYGSQRHKLGWDSKFVVTYVGAHGIANGLDQVLDAAQLLQDTNVLFVLIGDGMAKESLIKETQRRHITNVVFLPPVSKKEVFKYILASDMGASILKNVPAFKTVYSNKTFDYMACKKPILMAIDGVSRQLVEESQSGCYVTPEDPNAFDITLRKCMSNKDFLRVQGENGYRYAKQNFDRFILAEKYIDIIKGVALAKAV
jgi:glycosyltransferase involved in cell wall biosynthesis